MARYDVSLGAISMFREALRRARNVWLAAQGRRLQRSERQSFKKNELIGQKQSLRPAPPAPDISLILHHSRSARLRQIGPGAKVLCSAGCAGAWYFDWIENCYGPLDRHIGVEYYMPKPQQLPANVEWVENTVMDMSAVRDESCDLVFSGQNLEHLWPEEVTGFLRESWRILRPGGTLVIDSPNRDITEPLNWSHPEHTVEVTFAEAQELLALAGFDVNQCYGIWLCRDPKTQDILPFLPDQESSNWSMPERLILASGHPSESFIWWIEATKSPREPSCAKLERAMSSIFAKAWPERVQRLIQGVGLRERRADGDWIVCDEGQPGVMMYGPYMPLKKGRYRVGFRLHSTTADNSAGPVVQLEVMTGNSTHPILVRELGPEDFGDDEIVLEFELAELTFGVQFRCQSFGRARVECWRGIALENIGGGQPENV